MTVTVTVTKTIKYFITKTWKNSNKSAHKSSSISFMHQWRTFQR